MKQKEFELLAPAGDKDSFIAACQNGADAIYMGVSKFNARTMAKNFSVREYIECIEYAHKRNVKVYLTLNTLVYDTEIEEAVALVATLYQKGLDAVIVQDLGLAQVIHTVLPTLPLHASTQMSIYDIKQVKVLEKLGFTRVVLARELSIAQIQKIASRTSLEVEVFVHGALCVSVSGQCLMSAMIGERSANRGSCAQPCRMRYSLYQEKGKEVKSCSYLLSKKDIYGIEHLEALKAAGVTSFKIEGRNKTAAYVAGVVATYRKELDQVGSVQEKEKEQLLQLFNRSGKSTGYLEGVLGKESITMLTPKNTGLYLGKVIEQRNHFVKVKLEREIGLHDGIEIYDENRVYSNIITCIKNEYFQIENTSKQKGEYVWLGDIKQKVAKGSRMYKTSDAILQQRWRKSFTSGVERRQRKVPITIQIAKDKLPKVSATIFGKTVCCTGENVVQEAKTSGLTVEKIENIFSKTKEEPFLFYPINILLEENLFLPMAELNQLRRNILMALHGLFQEEKPIKYAEEQIFQSLVPKRKHILNERIETLSPYEWDPKKDYRAYYQKMYRATLQRLDISIFDYIRYQKQIEENTADLMIFLVIPAVVLEKGDHVIKRQLKNILENNKIAGVVLGSFCYLEELVKWKQQSNNSFMLIADESFNVANSYTASVLNKLGFDRVRCYAELESSQIAEIAKRVPVEMVQGMVTVMTSRYCILGSFVQEKEHVDNCSHPCLQHRYYLLDKEQKRYDIVCDSVDCIMRLIRNRRKVDWDLVAVESKVHMIE